MKIRIKCLDCGKVMKVDADIFVHGGLEGIPCKHCAKDSPYDASVNRMGIRPSDDPYDASQKRW